MCVGCQTGPEHPCLWQGDRTRWVFKSLPTHIIAGLCDSVLYVSGARIGPQSLESSWSLTLLWLLREEGTEAAAALLPVLSSCIP